MNLSKLGLRKTLTFSFGSILLTTLALSVGSWMGIRSLGNEIDRATGVSAEKSTLVAEVSVRSGKMRGALRGAILYSILKQPDLVSRSNAEFERFAADVIDRSGKLQALAQAEAEKQAAREIASSVEQWKPVVAEVLALCARSEFGDELTRTLRRSVKAADSLDVAAATLDKANKADLAAGRLAAASTVDRLGYLQAFFIMAAFACGVVGLMAVRSGTKKLHEITVGIAHGAEEVSGASAHVSSAGQSLAQGSSEQAAATEETSASAEELSVLTKRNSEQSRAARGVVDSVAAQVDNANRTLEQMTVSMAAIRTSTGKVSHIMKLIDEIAFQTNILALNAAVEAARAGEAGMGFAVVAEEVRNLAQRSAQAARDTAGLLEESIRSSQEGSERLTGVETAIHSITKSATTLTELVQEVSCSSDEQSKGVEHIAQAMVQMEQVTQNTAAIAEEAAAAGEQMHAQAQSLKHLGQDLHRLLDGHRS